MLPYVFFLYCILLFCLHLLLKLQLLLHTDYVSSPDNNHGHRGVTHSLNQPINQSISDKRQMVMLIILLLLMMMLIIIIIIIKNIVRNGTNNQQLEMRKFYLVFKERNLT